MLPNVVISQAAFDRTFPEPQDTQAFITVAGGPSPATTAELKRALATYPDAKIQTRTAWVTARASSVDQVLDLFYVLLGLSVIISVFGMVNTLVLAVPVPKGSRWFRRRSTDLQRCGGFRFLDPRQRSGPRASSTAIMQHVRSVQRLGSNAHAGGRHG